MMNYLERIISSRMRGENTAPEVPAAPETAAPVRENPPVHTRTSMGTSGRTSARTSARTSMRTSGRNFGQNQNANQNTNRGSRRTSYTSYSSRYTSYTSGRTSMRTSASTSQEHFGSSAPTHPVDEPFDPALLQAIPTCSADLLGYGLHLIDE